MSEASRSGAGPLVTILITSKDRPDDLRFTLTSLREQSYRNLEIILIDDGSEQSFESLLGKDFPEAVFIRHDRSMGLIAARSRGFTLARGEYLISLDDDSHFCHSDAIALAVDRLEREPDLGLLAFRILAGRDVAYNLVRNETPVYCHTYVGCGHMFRQAATRRAGGYMDEFQYGGEEEEYSLRVMDDGWKLLYFPEVTVHHRFSPIGRKPGRIAAYTYRNNVWTLFLRMPLPYALLHACWKSVMHVRNTMRHKQFDWGWWGFASCFKGLPGVFRQRRPVAFRTFILWHLLKLRRIRNAHDFEIVRRDSGRRVFEFLARNLRSRADSTTVS